ncbi:MAG TPA: hypothetical protein VE338_05740 [Ktedonobacterales bacterium]|jgi:hypothetical protein|nr:hypothetical protein [Ktedonobacterales bacterium]
MLPSAFIPFFAASVGVSGALIGLLFIAISIAPERTVGKAAPPERAAVAGAAFTALTNVFFVSFVGLIPLNTVGPVTIMLGILSCTATVRLTVGLLHSGDEHRTRLTLTQLVRRMSLGVGSLLIYGLEIWQGARVIVVGGRGAETVAGIAFLIVFIYGLALVRMWSLLGARKESLLAWFSILNDLHE